MWDTSCLDWRERIMSGRSLVPTFPLLNHDEAAKAVRVFNRLRLPDVIGAPLLADAIGDWFRDIVTALFGSYDPLTNRRAIQEVFCAIPKKNSKSTGAAAIMVTAAIVNRRPAAELVLIAPTKEVADIAFKQAAGMIKLDADLASLFHPQRHIRTITHRVSGAVIQIKAADTDAITGGKATFTLIDETHVFASKAHAADVFVELRGALASRPDGFLMQITTQSKRPPAGVFRAEIHRARRVRDGLQRLPLLPVIYELPEHEAENWRTPENMARVNPNLGRSVDRAFLTRELETAEQEGPEALALFASQHANKEIGLALHSDRWAGADYWEDQADDTLTLDDLLARSEVVVVGIDGGGLDDLLGLAVLGRDRLTRDWLHWGHAWAHPAVLKRRLSEAPRLRDLAAAGDLTLVQSVGEDVEQVADLVQRIDTSELLHSVGLDPQGVGAMVDAMAERGITGDKRIIGISQGWTMTNSIKTAERKLADGTLHHGGQPLMAWAVGNAKVEPRGNAIIITKQTAGSAKVDPLLALFNAVSLMSRNPEAMNGPSMYENTGIRMLG